jgi:short-chain fatty acids transporter
VREFATKDPILAISNLNTYNLLFLMLGALLHWRPRNFLNAVAKAVPATTGVLIQFPLYGGIATIMTTAKGAGGLTVADQISHAFVALTTHRWRWASTPPCSASSSRPAAASGSSRRPM